MSEKIKIAPSADKRFLISKVCIDKFDLKGKGFLFNKQDPPEIGILSSYDLYWSCDQDFEKFVVSYELGGEFSGNKLLEAISANNNNGNLVNIFWVKRGGFTITVPWGIRLKNRPNDEKGVCSELSFTNIAIEKFIKNYEFFAWESIMQNRLTYQYLSEYFIDSDGKQNGISITMRNYFDSTIQTVIDEIISCKKNLDNCELAKCIKNAINYFFTNDDIIGNKLSSIGMKFMECRNVKVTNF